MGFNFFISSSIQGVLPVNKKPGLLTLSLRGCKTADKRLKLLQSLKGIGKIPNSKMVVAGLEATLNLGISQPRGGAAAASPHFEIRLNLKCPTTSAPTTAVNSVPSSSAILSSYKTHLLFNSSQSLNDSFLCPTKINPHQQPRNVQTSPRTLPIPPSRRTNPIHLHWKNERRARLSHTIPL